MRVKLFNFLSPGFAEGEKVSLIQIIKRAIKWVLRSPFMQWIISLPSNIASSQLILTLFVKSKFLSVLYYIFFSSSFQREQQAILYGRLSYLRELHSIHNNRYLLRRNTHRLEKGLLMRPRRSVFALNYIEETVNSYKQIASNDVSDEPIADELKWAHDVLKKYFDVADISHPLIKEVRNTFLSVGEIFEANEVCYIPYKRDLNTPPPVSYEQILKLAQRRRSVRWYLPKPVPRELIDKAVLVADQSPSACNRQPFKFYIFDDPEWVKKVANMPMGTKGFSHNFPVVIAMVGSLRAYYHERDRHVIYIDGSLAAMSLMFALETQGLSSCPINWPDIEFREKRMSKLLQLEPDERVIMLLSVGYPDPEGLVAYSQKKGLDELRSYNLS